MAIPTKEQFNQSLRLLNTLDAVELVEEYWDRPNLDSRTREEEFKLSYLKKALKKGSSIRDYYTEYATWGDFKLKQSQNDVKRFIERKYDLIRLKFDQLVNTPAFIWLTSQPAFKAAEKNIFGSENDDFDYSEALGIVVSRFISAEPEFFMRMVLRELEKSHGQFYQTLLSKLKNYFYSDFDQYLGALKKRKLVAKKAKTYIDELVEIECVLSKLEGRDEYSERWSRPGHYKKIIRLLERASIEIEDMSLMPRFKPIRKGDTTAKERLMVFNLWRSFLRDFRGRNKTNFVTAISHLMYLDGIENPIGQRAIEKLIQGWRDTRREISNNDTYHELRLERQELKKGYSIHLR